MLPERFHLFPRVEKTVERLKNIGGGLLWLIGNQVIHEPKPIQSDHYRPPGEQIKAVHQAEWNELNLPQVPTQEEIVEVFNRDWSQIPRNYDGNGSEVAE